MRKRAVVLVPFLLTLFIVPALADDKGDIQALIDDYCRTEGDLAAQAKLMTDDRVFINQGRRQTDQATNMKVQKAGQELNQQLDPGAQLIVTGVDPIIRVYGDAAVASFYRFWDVIPSAEFVKANPDVNTSGPPPNVVTLVVVKQGGAWKIAHTHMSPLRPNN